MANHKSALKRIRSSEKRRVHNRYYARTMRNAVNAFRQLTDKNEATEQLPKVVALVDRVAKRNIIHNNKAANLKSSLYRQVNNM
ncbi:30S ribosomal protein S20 [Salibacter halophilus]|uniref:Small ribosomal subunit protein bS20 n=1 Tax=Salibacter halophilus TaxID=1803916 RepID=A0A6N6M7X7_9FLAO|nr:30S ribosomal protein S20 [Salibacter halophilus]KAB1066190.1 30S ribosomal protein S20 [Salibacter halophilus]